jgi:hypothetical protein
MRETMSTSGERGDIRRFTEAIPSHPSQQRQAVFVPSVLQATCKEVPHADKNRGYCRPSVPRHQPPGLVRRWDLSKSRALLATSTFRGSSLLDELGYKQNAYIHNP